MRKAANYFILFFYIFLREGIAQESFSLNGFKSFMNKDFISSTENNATNFSSVKDVAIGVLFGAELTSPTASNLYAFGIAKTFGGSNIFLRYSPGFFKEFTLLKNQSIVGSDSSAISLKTDLKYQEYFSAGYSYKISGKLSGGFTLKYFNEEFSQDAIGAVFTDSSLSLIRNNETESMKLWNVQFGCDYLFTPSLRLSLSASNFFNMKNGSLSETNKAFELRTPKNLRIALYTQPLQSVEVNLLYETFKAMQASVGKTFLFNKFSSSLDCTYFSDFSLNGIQPSLSLQYGNICAAVTGVIYFSNIKKTSSLSDLTANGITNLVHNKYSSNKVAFNLSYLLNTTQEKLVQFVDVTVANSLFPTFTERFVDEPFAVARVVNLSDKPVSVKPSSKIDKINSEVIYSPNVLVQPKDTVSIPFYTVVSESYFTANPEISFVNFFLLTENRDTDDEIQKPILVNSSNAWDGEVSNLRYFVKKDFDFSSTTAKRLLSAHKNELDTANSALLNFLQAKILFNEIITGMLYIADPLASNDRVQFPHETIDVKGGDCDDLSVCLASLYESIGIETAFVDYRGNDHSRHVHLLFNTNLSPAEAGLITQNDKKYYVRKNSLGEEKIWIPLETTERSNFTNAWEKGVEKFSNEALDQLGLIKGTVQIIEIY
ncbi:MAG: hypothetical protein COZ80_00765 [Ignavibacteria bacterium CG_4_8_14_3_um_filter_37_9]|nr:MAG: hypothetical protein AUJ54_09580 [Ignavibacteria bacterium CG1_02_37_35]PIX00326.1 MAG: hypothetical protein COZ80_00765 [Ignavibacteria bacterium CG_4_8_14_3_um_filter_37_9]PIX95356.1 MAG: hypothetical protein COZ25_00870 [Ignavibacteria bacterium CG_4_10_14_3_um_filter_37_18]